MMPTSVRLFVLQIENPKIQKWRGSAFSAHSTKATQHVEQFRNALTSSIITKSKMNTMKRLLFFTCIVVTTRAFEFPIFSFAPTAPKVSSQVLLRELDSLIQQCPKNGLDTPEDLEDQILDLCRRLEKQNPTKAPVKNSKMMSGFWRMEWTNFAPAAPSSGKLGPFVGDVFQDVDLTENQRARNILRVNFPPICGELTASTNVVNDSTLAITFQTVGNKIGGVIPLGPKIDFEGREVRLWEHVYLDDEYRILYARRQEEEESRGFLYVMKRADDERFETGV